MGTIITIATPARKILHPYHPQHPLTYIYQNPKLGLIYEYYSESNISAAIFGSQPPTVFHECTWCTSKLKGFREAVSSIDSRDFYGCLQCDLFFHEVCAGHPLVLDTCPTDDYEGMHCPSCSRLSSGFRYICADGCTDGSAIGCMERRLQLKLCCILVPEYFTHKAHEHPLFISIGHWGDLCEVCKDETSWLFHLQCTQCEFAMCYPCATIPNELYCKYDDHPLFLYYGESVDEIYWCEVCEEKIDTIRRFYTCNKCCTTIHYICLFDSFAYMKCGYTFGSNSIKVEIVRNSSSRPICSACGQRCPGSVFVKLPEKTFCSMSCVEIEEYSDSSEE